MAPQPHPQARTGAPSRPCRIGTTSYVIPDEIVPNVRFLAGLVDDVELVLFESDESGNLPSGSEVAQLVRLAHDHGLTYTVHLPLDARLGAADEGLRERGVGKCTRVIDATRALEPFAWIVHLDGERRGRVPADDVPAWTDRCARSLDALVKTGIPPARIAVETLDYPFSCVAEILPPRGISACLDIGHVVLHGYDATSYMDAYLPTTRVVHAHGIVDGRDHRALDAFPGDILAGLLDRLAAHPAERVLTLEVFDEAAFRTSLAVLEGMIGWAR
jgi:sugar phosphate isomerase/epimerase